MVTRLHSARTVSRPRNENWRNSSADYDAEHRLGRSACASYAARASSAELARMSRPPSVIRFEDLLRATRRAGGWRLRSRWRLVRRKCCSRTCDALKGVRRQRSTCSKFRRERPARFERVVLRPQTPASKSSQRPAAPSSAAVARPHRFEFGVDQIAVFRTAKSFDLRREMDAAGLLPVVGGLWRAIAVGEIRLVAIDDRDQKLASRLLSSVMTRLRIFPRASDGSIQARTSLLALRRSSERRH